ncbi:NADPH-dependent FMN reductase [Nitrincola iocasae]|uniref:NADPH-dependent FMN reductase n=1 Tax=Nitrincola iocasae TaxID=2614693 RepID=UPI001CD9355D|nr:NAD(P)H-dependent oxidoreductase [Nitrincola iocasae]
MKLIVISGSQRAQSKSLLVAQYLHHLAETHFDQVQVYDLHELNLPLWNEGVWSGMAWRPQH